MNLSFNGFNENLITLEADDTLVKAGAMVTLTEEGKVASATEGDKICGVCINVRDGFAAVQITGYANLPCADKIPCGFQKITADAQGAAVVGDTGREVLVVTSESGNVGVIL